MSENDKKDKHFITQDDIITVLNSLYNQSIKGISKVSPPITDLADDYLRKSPNPEVACKKMIKNQIAKCTTSGFVTGFGGVITLPVTIPANISSVLYVQMRMVACVAYMAGYELDSDQVQTFVYACLAGVSVNEVVKLAGIKTGMKVAQKGIEKIPGKALVKINQKIGFRFITKFGETGIVNLGKLIPGVGAVVNGGLDFAETKIIADRAYKMFFEGDFSAGQKPEDEIPDEIVSKSIQAEIIEPTYDSGYKMVMYEGIQCKMYRSYINEDDGPLVMVASPRDLEKAYELGFIRIGHPNEVVKYISEEEYNKLINN
ncbi:MAG: EcsC family protein [Clostridiales bacterium]|nr:EcsC family protein [Clostridiales bacterium]